MNKALRIGVAGPGTVGIGVIKLLRDQADLLEARAGVALTVTGISARDKNRDRGVNLSGLVWHDDPVNLAKSPDIDVFVELIGGSEGPARLAVEAALKAGKPVVTANKALVAHHGMSLAQAADSNGAALAYEAAVAGGIPVIKAIREGLVGNRVSSLQGILNGTCNYILTRMQATGQGYNALFEEASALGYLEADPNLDVGGIDAAHKLAILSSLAFGTRVDFGGIALEGIQRVSIEDITAAADMGYKIKLLGVAQKAGRGLEQRMQPCLVPETSPLGQLDGGTNMVVIEGDAVGQIVLRGAGAGEGPTASALMADVCDIARGLNGPVFGQPATTLKTSKAAQSQLPAPYYLRMALVDKPGAMAKIATVLGDAGVSINRMRQYEHDDISAPVLIVTHKTSRSALDAAIEAMDATGVMAGAPVALRIEEV